MELIYESAMKAGRQADWDDPNWSMIDMGGLDLGARYLLGIAVARNDLKLAEWLLAHGASPNAARKPGSKFPARSLYEEALRQGFTEMADLLERFGATPSGPLALEGEDPFTSACFRLDREEARAILEKRPEYLRSPAVMFAAARQDRVDVVTFLLDLGMSIEIEDERKQRPLHEAASHDSFGVAALLIERGAEIDPVETNWGATPLGYAVYGQKTRMINLLSHVSCNVWELTNSGKVERLRELLAVEPGLAKVASESNTPLMWLPDDEARAMETVELLLAHGADPTIRNKEGMTAADCAEKRGLYDVAELLRSKAGEWV
jgi:ankyrin repeat protein